MTGLPDSITITIALLALFLIIVTSIRYAILNNFVRTRFSMTAFFVFIIVTITISFYPYVALTLPYAIPAFILGALAGYVFGVRTEQQKLRIQGLEYYMEHFAHIRSDDLKSLTWWSFINFYSVMGGLALINLVGLATVIFPNVPDLIILATTLGALLIGSIVPYLAHLWSVPSAKA